MREIGGGSCAESPTDRSLYRTYRSWSAQRHGIEIPDEIVTIVERAIDELSEGRSVALVRIDEELTTQQVADLLNVSRPFVTKLLDRGEISHHRVGTHRRVYRSDAEAYRDRQMRRAKRAMRATAKQAEDFGLYH